MALPSNVFRKPSGRPLPFFSECAVPGSSGVNVFAQRRPHGVVYAFPPFVVIPALINLLLEWGSVEALLVLPLHPSSRPAWRNLLHPYVISQRLLSSPVDLGIVSLPSTSGFSANHLPLGFGLSAFRCSFPPSSFAISCPYLDSKHLKKQSSLIRLA